MTDEKQKQGTVKVLRHTSEVLRGNPLNDPFERDLHVYLPPNYEDSDTKFPVVYLLTGFTGRGKMLFNDTAFSPNIAERLDKLIAEKTIQPLICVMPDCFTHFGGSQYINSAATGNYEDYLTEEIVPFVDENLRTKADRNFRAAMGTSSGGYGALILAMRHADQFGLACSTSGDCYFDLCYLPDFPKAFRAFKGEPRQLIEKFWDENARKNQNDFAGLNVLGMSACYSPNADAEMNFDLPFDLKTGELRGGVWEKWRAHDPVFLVEKYAENLKSMKLLFLDAGTRDEFALDLGARILSRRLRDAKIPHIHEEFEDGHFNIKYRYNRSLEMISKNFAEE